MKLVGLEVLNYIDSSLTSKNCSPYARKYSWKEGVKWKCSHQSHVNYLFIKKNGKIEVLTSACNFDINLKPFSLRNWNGTGKYLNESSEDGEYYIMINNLQEEPKYG